MSLTVKMCQSVNLNENELTQQIALQLYVGWMSLSTAHFLKSWN